MRAMLACLMFVFLAAAATPAAAPAPTPTAAPVAATAAPAPAAPAPAAPVVAPAPAPTAPAAEVAPTPTEVVKEAGEVAAAAGKYFTGSKDGDRLGLFVLIAVVLKFLLSLLKLTGSFWSETRGKWVLRMITLGLGVVIAIVSSMAGGMSWPDAIMLGLAGPGAVAVHEYQKLIPYFNKKK